MWSDYKLTWSHHSSQGSIEFSHKCAFLFQTRPCRFPRSGSHFPLPIENGLQKYLSFRAKSHVQTLFIRVHWLGCPTYSFYVSLHKIYALISSRFCCGSLTHSPDCLIDGLRSTPKEKLQYQHPKHNSNSPTLFLHHFPQNVGFFLFG